MAEPFSHDAEFMKLCHGRDDIDLVDCMFELAADAYPELDLAESRAELTRLRGEAATRASALGSADLAERLEAISDLLYLKEGFRGNREAYYDPRNSYLHEVIARRRGIPITLGILYMSVAAGGGVAVSGVPAPGHFMLMASDHGGTWYIDPFSEGEVLDSAACRRRLREIAGEPREEWLRAASSLEIVVRVLRNLKAAYAMEDQWSSVLPVQERLVALLPAAQDEERDLGLVLLRSGKPHAALTLLSNYVETAGPDAAKQIEPYLRSARKLAAEMN